MATHPRDSEDDWVRDWSETKHFFSAVMLKIEQNKLAIHKSHEESRARQTLRETRGREYFKMLQEMQTMTDPRRAAAPRLIPTMESGPRQSTDALDISLMPTMLVPAVKLPERAATTDEIPVTSRTRQLTQFYQDAQERWCYIDTCQQGVHDLISKAIDTYVHELDTLPVQTLRIASTNMLYLIIDHKLKEDIYQDERGSFTLTSDPHVDVDTVIFG